MSRPWLFSSCPVPTEAVHVPGRSVSTFSNASLGVPYKEEEEDMHSLRFGFFCVVLGTSILIETTLHAQSFSGDPVKGQTVYQQFCLKCHGDALDGKGPEAASLSVPPANFHASHSRIKSENELRFTIRRGRDLTDMHRWEDETLKF